MNDSESLSHTKWDCKYHIVWIPKYRKKTLFTGLRSELGRVFRSLAEQKESEILEGHFQPDHVHILIRIPPKLLVSSVVGFIKGKSAIFTARNVTGRRRNFVGESFWARGFYVSPVGLDEEVLRNYIKHQAKEDQLLDQLTLL